MTYPPKQNCLPIIHLLFPFSVTTSSNELNNDLKKISDWAFQWKMSFNPDPSKQAQEVIFSRKLKNVSHPPLVFNNANVSSCKSQKHIGILLDANLTFEEHYKTILSKSNRTIGLLRKLQSLLPRAALITIKLLLDLSSTTVMFSIIKHLTLRSMRN